MLNETDCAGAIGGVQQLFKHESRLHRYLLVQHPHVGHLSLVVLVQPSQLLADLLHVVVLPDQLDVVLSHRLQLVFQLSVLAGQTAVQSAEENTAVSAIKDKLKNAAGLFCATCIVKKIYCSPELDLERPNKHLSHPQLLETIQALKSVQCLSRRIK